MAEIDRDFDSFLRNVWKLSPGDRLIVNEMVDIWNKLGRPPGMFRRLPVAGPTSGEPAKIMIIHIREETENDRAEYQRRRDPRGNGRPVVGEAGADRGTVGVPAPHSRAGRKAAQPLQEDPANPPSREGPVSGPTGGNGQAAALVERQGYREGEADIA